MSRRNWTNKCITGQILVGIVVGALLAAIILSAVPQLRVFGG